MNKLRVPALSQAQLWLFALVGLSLLVWFWSYNAELALAYNDSKHYMNQARAVFDNQQPGLAQLGTVWLPLNKLLMLPLVWNTWAWQSGFAGSVVSMLSYVAGSVAAFYIVHELTKNRIAAIAGAAAYAFNLNLLYLQTTPLTEPLYLALFMLSVLLLIRYVKTENNKLLPLLGLLGALQIATRYDGWFVVIVEAWILFYFLWKVKRFQMAEISGRLLLYALPVVFVAALWFLWNYALFDDPFYFAFGPNAAHTQQQDIASNEIGLLTKFNLPVAAATYTFAMLENTGVFASLFALLGFIIWFRGSLKKFSTTAKWMVVAILLAPIFFNVLALFLGFSVIYVPQIIAQYTNIDPLSYLFNIRYGIMALPLVAIGMGLAAAHWDKRFVATVFAAIVLQQTFIWQQGIVTLLDGTLGKSAFTQEVTAKQLQENVPKNETVLLSTAHFNPVAFESGLPFKAFVHEGLNKQWPKALETPEQYADWVVMKNHDVGDPVYNAFIKVEDSEFIEKYSLYYKNEEARIYKLQQTKIAH